MVYICVYPYTALPTLLAVAQPGCQPGTQSDSASQILNSGCPGGAEEVSGKAKSPGGEFLIQKPEGLWDVGAVGVQEWEHSGLSAGFALGPP